MGWLPNSLEVAVTTLAAVLFGWLSGLLVFSCLALLAWAIGAFMQQKGYYQYEQRYISELNPVLLEIRDGHEGKP